MSRYHIDTPARLALVQRALDQEFGLRDAAGNPTPREHIRHHPFYGSAPVSAFLGTKNHTSYTHPGQHWPIIEGDDGTAAIRVAESVRIDARLGRTAHGVALPRVVDLIEVTRPREHSRLPAGVRDKLDDEWIDKQLDGTDAADNPRDTPQARAKIADELQGRATAALSRKGARGQGAAPDRGVRGR